MSEPARVRSSVSSVSERKRPGANGPAVWQLALGLTAAVAVGWLLAAAARFARRRGYRRGAPVRRRTGQRVAGALARVTALLDLGMIALIAVLPGLVDSGFIGWLDIPLGQRLVWRLPLAVAVLMLALLGIWNHWLDPRLVGPVCEVAVRWALLLATAFLTAQLISWGLIGWGWT
ncbi:MAG TPA: hypothetical protein VI094_20290 [Propionibacteriaceae bacterium]